MDEWLMKVSPKHGATENCTVTTIEALLLEPAA